MIIDGTMHKESTTSIHSLPNLLEYYAFILFPPSLLVGPYLEYAEWQVHLQNRQCIQVQQDRVIVNALVANENRKHDG